MRIGKLNLNIIEQGRRIIKGWTLTKRDVKTFYQVSPWGDDSAPVLDSDIVVSDTKVGDTRIVLGVISTDKKANAGEKRIFATDQDGNTVVDIYLRNDGTVEIVGNTDNAVRYSALETAFNDLQDQWNAFANAYTPGSPTVLGTPPTATPSTGDIAASKIEEIKVP